MIKCWWWCLRRNGYRETYTYDERGRLCAISATDSDHRMAKIFWALDDPWEANLP